MNSQLKQTYEISDRELMKWYSGGKSFQDIMKALQTSQLADLSPSEILSRTDSQSWDEIWKELGVVP